MSNNSPVDSFKSLPKFDQGVLATGVLAFIVSFFPWYGISIGGFSASVNAWHSYSWLAVMLVLAATAVAAVGIFAKDSMPELPIGAAWLVAGLSVVGTLLELLRLLTLHHGDGVGIKWGGYLLAIVMIANAVFAFLGAQSSGQAAPWDKSGSSTPPAPPAA